MASVTVDRDALQVQLRLWDRILAVHGSLTIPLDHVLDAAAHAAPPVPWFSKLVGTNVPGFRAAGTFFTSDGLAFYDYHAGHNCLVLELAHETYKRAVIEIDPPTSAAAVAAAISAALASRNDNARPSSTS